MLLRGSVLANPIVDGGESPDGDEELYTDSNGFPLMGDGTYPDSTDIGDFDSSGNQVNAQTVANASVEIARMNVAANAANAYGNGASGAVSSVGGSQAVTPSTSNAAALNSGVPGLVNSTNTTQSLAQIIAGGLQLANLTTQQQNFLATNQALINKGMAPISYSQYTSGGSAGVAAPSIATSPILIIAAIGLIALLATGRRN